MNVVELSHGRGLLPAPAATSLHRLDADLGHPVQVTEAGRTYERQLYLWQQWQAGVAGFNPAWHPDDSRANHVLTDGRTGAVDSDQQTGVPWEAHGWVLTVPHEPWHREYFIDRDQYVDSGDDIMGAADDVAWIKRRIGGSLSRDTNVSEDIDELKEQVRWLMNQVGGSNDRDTTLRQDVDRLGK